MNNSIEKIKAYHGIKNFISPGEQKELALKLGLTDVDLTRRIMGQDNEIEFILMLYLLDSCEHIIAFEEGVSALTKTNTPDLLVELKNKQKILIEIKSTQEEQFKISKGNLNKREKFANHFGYPLYFAIKLKGYWMMFSSDYLISKGGKIDITNANDSILDTITGNRKIIFPSGVKIISYYSKKYDSGLKISSEYGYLQHYCMMYGDKLLFAYNKQNEETLPYVILSEAIQDGASIQKQKVEEIDEVTTMVTEELINTTGFDTHLFVMAPINHIIRDSDINEDPNSYYRKLASGETEAYKIEYYNLLFEYLQSKGLDLIYI